MEGRKTITEIFYPEDLPEEIRSEIEKSKDRMFRHDGRIYLRTSRQVLCCEDNDAGEELIREIVSAGKGSAAGTHDKKAVLRNVLTDPDYLPDGTLLKKYRIETGAEATVTVFRSEIHREKDLSSDFSMMVPLEDDDLIVPIDSRNVALIRKAGYSVTDDMKEFAEAVLGTLEGEGIIGISAGIGCVHSGLEGLRKSFTEANEALSTGRKFSGKDHVFSYKEITLERILNCIPKERAAEIRREYPNICSDDGLTDEIRETVSVFFRNDLNLTAASKQLFIHRNTLNYRLDKIRRETGLDLRSFHDAVIFRILSGLAEKK